MSKEPSGRATSTELTGGAGFTYEDTVAAYYLAALLRAERAAPLPGIVRSVAVQQEGHGHPMDDIVVELDDAGVARTLGLQAKRRLQISARNADFADIMQRAVATRAREDFRPGVDAHGFVVENVAIARLRTLTRIIDWARSSPSGEHFAGRFADEGSAAAAERAMRAELAPLIGATSSEQERAFYADLVAVKLEELTPGGVTRTEVINRLQDLVAGSEDGQDTLLFDRLCRLAREGSATARKWTRGVLLDDLRGAVRLRTAPNYRHDIDVLRAYSTAGLADVSEEVAGVRIPRPVLEQEIRGLLGTARVVNLSGQPGCGKSAMLKRLAAAEMANGPILFLKSDRLEGRSWLSCATALGLQHRDAAELLAEVGATGSPILFIDGIDRVRPDQRGIVTDILRTIEENEHLRHWKVLATSRDQGLEAYRAWFPAAFYRGSFIGDVPVGVFSDEEARLLAQEVPALRRLLFGSGAVQEIARRPFFAAVLARSLPEDQETPQTEVDLIDAWWNRAGHDAEREVVPQRQRALLNLAQKGARNLGRNVPTRLLSDATMAHVAALEDDRLIRAHDGGASYSFAHDIFFEWAFLRHLISLGENWASAIAEAGEAPLLGRVVALRAQHALSTPGSWSAGYRQLEPLSLRPQWRREWLTAPPFTTAFATAEGEFRALLAENDYALFEKLLVWIQSQHTIPSPVVLRNPAAAGEGMERIGVAELLAWPSDIEGWVRLLDWLMPLVPSLPARLLPNVLTVFDVWQNVFSGAANPRSARIVEICAHLLVELEVAEYPESGPKESVFRARRAETPAGLARALRSIILRSAHSYPAPARALFERAVANRDLRRAIYGELMQWSLTMAVVAPELVVAVAKAELLQELPEARKNREKRERQQRIAFIERVRAIPESERTEKQKRALEMPFFPIGDHEYDRHDIGLSRHDSNYFPVSALEEPFDSLFAKAPEAALGLVRDLANHAVAGWRQVHALNRGRMGTPIPVKVAFPWGEQEFWGDWHVYSWGMGELGAPALECAFLAMGYWAFKEIDRGRPPAEVIRAVVEGNACYAALGLALTLALETYEVSETTLPIASCQRLWHHDMQRLAQEPTRNVDLLGLGVFSRLTGAKAEAKAYLDSRLCRHREVRELATRFALSSDAGLAARFKDALVRFPEDLPYEVEEQRGDEESSATLKERAERWSGLGDRANYREVAREGDRVLIGYEPPVPPTAEQEQRVAQSTATLQEYRVIGWAKTSLSNNAIAEGFSLADAVAFAKLRDAADLLHRRREDDHSAQSVVAWVAAVIIRLAGGAGADHAWAWDVMGRVARMSEPEGVFSKARIPWHPARALALALFHDRAGAAPHADSAQRLLALAAHPLDEVSSLAFEALFRDPDAHLGWVAGQLAVDFAIYHRFQITADGRRDHAANEEARRQSLARALRRLDETVDTPLSQLPLPWVEVEVTEWRRRSSTDPQTEWGEPNPSFDPDVAARLFALFPVEAWCQSRVYRPMFAAMLRQCVAWTADRLMPPWRDLRRRGRDSQASELGEWNEALGNLVARAAPFFAVDVVRRDYLGPFLTVEEEGLPVLAAFADRMVTRHILDAAVIPANTLELLGDCVDRLVSDRVFELGRHHSGEVHGFDLPKLISALLFVPIDEEAPGAARFANGDWSEIGVVMPLVTRLVTDIGWSAFVADKFLTLCERAGDAYPVADFAQQASAIVRAAGQARKGWSGTVLPARLSRRVQQLADAHYPLRVEDARELLKALDGLIDLGDRRSAALEQTEAFKGIQGPPRAIDQPS
jgi:hypothetical protein